MTRHALRGATWMLAAGLAVVGIGGVLRALGTGLLALMPSMSSPIVVGTALAVFFAKVGVALAVLSRLARPASKDQPPWLALVLLIAFGLTGVVLGMGSGWAQAFLIQRAMSMGTLADFSITQSIVAGVSHVLHLLIDVGTLIGAAWLWQKHADRAGQESEPPLADDRQAA